MADLDQEPSDFKAAMWTMSSKTCQLTIDITLAEIVSRTPKDSFLKGYSYTSVKMYET